MKAIFKKLILILLLIPIPASAQNQVREVGFIRIVNAVGPGEGNTFITVNETNLYDKGYKLGQRTGGVGIRSGEHSITVEKEGVQSGTTNFQIETGETLSLIAFAERIESEDDSPKWVIRILRLKQKDVDGRFHVSFVSVCEEPIVYVQALVAMNQDPEEITVRRLEMSQLDIGARRGGIVVNHGGEMIDRLVTHEPGNYVVILYQDEEGKVKALSFYDPKFMIAG